MPTALLSAPSFSQQVRTSATRSSHSKQQTRSKVTKKADCTGVPPSPPTKKCSVRCDSLQRSIQAAMPAEVVATRRTLPGELSHYIIVGYDNPRVFTLPQHMQTLSSSSSQQPKKSKKPCSVPTQEQIAVVRSKSLPKHLSACFTERLMFYQNSEDTPVLSVGNVIPCGTQICKTAFVASIHFALSETFGFENVMVEQCEHMASDHDMTRFVVVPHALEIVVLDAVLARSKTHTLPLLFIGATVDKPVKMHIAEDYLKNTNYVDHSGQWLLCSLKLVCITVIESAGRLISVS